MSRVSVLAYGDGSGKVKWKTPCENIGGEAENDNTEEIRNVDCSIPIFNPYLDICYIYVSFFFFFIVLLYFRDSKHPFCHLNGRVEAPTSDSRLVAWSLVPSERERLTRVFISKI